jgi:hypothetical protein
MLKLLVKSSTVFEKLTDSEGTSCLMNDFSRVRCAGSRHLAQRSCQEHTVVDVRHVPMKISDSERPSCTLI